VAPLPATIDDTAALPAALVELINHAHWFASREIAEAKLREVPADLGSSTTTRRNRDDRFWPLLPSLSLRHADRNGAAKAQFWGAAVLRRLARTAARSFRVTRTRSRE